MFLTLNYFDNFLTFTRKTKFTREVLLKRKKKVNKLTQLINFNNLHP